MCGEYIYVDVIGHADTMTSMVESDTLQVNSEAGTMIINDSDDDVGGEFDDDSTMKSESYVCH